MNDKHPSRKPTRLKDFDYSSSGAYFLTICTEHRKNLLSDISLQENKDTVGEGLAPPKIKLKPCGEIAEQELLDLENRFPNIKIDRYVIMPNHIHLILFVFEASGGASPSPTKQNGDLSSKSPTVAEIVCAFKSLTTRKCKRNV